MLYMADSAARGFGSRAVVLCEGTDGVLAQGKLIPHHGEALVLRTWPFGEADLLVSLFTREGGVVKGLARHALRSRRRFGGALEPGTHVTAHYTERPRLAGMQLVTEVLEQALPEQAPEDNLFRLALAVLRATEGEPVWLPVTYFCLWVSRLMGWLPELGRCAVCGLPLRGADLCDGAVWWSPAGDGVTCGDDRRPGSRVLSPESVVESYRMARTALPQMLEEGAWPRERAADLRAFALGLLERHLERRIRSAAALG